MELLRMFTRIRKIELEIQTINENNLDIDHPSMSPFHIEIHFLFINYQFSVEQYVSRLMLYDNDYLSESSILE